MPFPYRFGQPDERTDSDRLEELRSLQRQVQSILTSRDDRAFAEAFVTRVRERRAGLANRTQFARIPDKHGSFSLAAVTQRQEAEPSEPGELLIHADEFDRVRHVLELYELVDSAGLTRPEYVAELKDKVVRLRGGRLNQVERANLASNLRRQGVRISVNYMTPMGGPVKSVGTPEPTAGPVPACPLAETEETESSPVRVLIIDTGVYGLRGDVWLTDLDTEANREDLDYFPPDGYLDLAAGHGSFCAGIVQQIVPEAVEGAHDHARTVGADWTAPVLEGWERPAHCVPMPAQWLTAAAAEPGRSVSVADAASAVQWLPAQAERGDA